MNSLPLIEKLDSSNVNFRSRTKSTYIFSFSFFIFLIIIGFLVLMVRLFQLTVVQGAYYHRLAEENRIKEIVVEPQRGTILDRNGGILVQNAPPDVNQSDTRLISKRIYTDPEVTAPVIGYRQTADKQDLDNDPCLNKAQSGDKVGKKGAEKLFECDLRGRVGKKLIELDARGNYIRTLSLVPPVNGKPLQLSLDLHLQQKSAQLMNQLSKDKQSTSGAIVAMNPKTGEILSLYSSPSFNSQDFEDNNQPRLQQYLVDSNHPLFNRATEGAYPPGSIFKLFTASGALEDKTISEDTLLEDNGILKAGSLTFGNWYFLQYGKTEGSLNIVKAIRRSTDTFFYQVGAKMGPERMKYWADRFGLGKKVNIDLDQAEGILPSPYWKEETLKDQWYTGDTYNMSIGQGYILVTPLQIAQATSAIANNGILCSPGVLKDQKSGCADLRVSQKTLDLVKEGMKGACSPGGTGWPLFGFSVDAQEPNRGTVATDSATPKTYIQTACKTGTAEDSDKTRSAHAWITVFAPFANPEIAVTVLVENGGQGSDVAGPMAREILKTYFEEHKN